VDVTYEHVCVNVVQINAQTDLALRYNDISPLENHHCAIAFAILAKVLRCVTLSYVVLHCVTLCYTVLHCVTLCYTVLRCVTLCYVVLHCVTLCYVVLR